ncbi:hypothetical protein AVEN_169162-1 [Araneus ventricosus]|uniref:Uncharacterized protein n=1 Tax=Araneus ventricosus TaxID=182803 RepID=A0A4Y2KBP2_ARAVE|nr:hypothetical protein AVEN_169162-1 [Araneus ventricosus]
MNNVYLHRRPRFAGNKVVGSEEHRFETRYHQRSAVYARLVYVETVTDPHLLAREPPLPSGKVSASGTKGSRPDPITGSVDFGIKRQNSFDVSNLAGSGRNTAGLKLVPDCNP